MNNNVNVHYSHYLTIEERVLVGKLRDMLDAKEFEYDEEKFNDNYLIRFLIAEKLNLDKAYIKFTKYVTWYVKNKVNKIHSFSFPELTEVDKYYKTGYHKCDKMGRPIYIEIFENYELNKLFKETTTHERLNTFYIQKLEKMFNEYLPACSRFYNKYIYQCCIIMDIRKIDFQSLNKDVFEFVRIRADYDQSYYPEMLGQLIVINNSTLIKTLWSVVSSFIDDKTKNKVLLCSEEDYITKLNELVDKSQLPSLLGGECNCVGGCLSSNEGPWKNK